MLGIFFFQAEDGIRDHCVTGVQTCALPISQPRMLMRCSVHSVHDSQAGSIHGLIHISTCRKQPAPRSEEHTSELQSHSDLVCRLLLEKKKNNINHSTHQSINLIPKKQTRTR